MKQLKHLIFSGLLLILWAVLPALSAAAGQGEVRKVEVFPAADGVRVEVTLSALVTGTVETAQHPDRLVLKLPGTVSDAQQTRIAVRQFGVRSIRYGLNRANPPETHLVVDLDGEHSYKLSNSGTKIILLVEPPLSTSARWRTGPAAAATKPLIHSLGRGSNSGSGQPGTQSNQETVLLTPPPSGPPINFPTSARDSQSSKRSSSSDQSSDQPSATHPNNASLQQGTVFPSQGSPGAGVVPPVSGAASSTNANARPGLAQQPFPLEPKIGANVSSEPAASVRQDKPTLPPSSGQNVADNSAEKSAVPTEPSPTQGSGQGTAPQLMARQGENPDFRTAFRVKYVAQDAAYLDGGRAAGLTEGMKLVVRDLPNAGGVAAAGADSNAAGDVAELEVMSVAEGSAVTEIHTPKRAVKAGDLAYLSSADQQALVEKNALSATRKYPAVVSFTENDTLDEEARAEVPKPPLPSVNRSRGRIGFDYIGVVNHGGSGMYSNNLGVVLQTDITRIGGTYWNVSGYWRGRLNKTSAGSQTLQDLINRTYHLYTDYTNPNSSWVAGFGRLYLPWATSLDTLDGGYIGRKLKTGVTAGVFMGSTPDPTSFSYNPNQEIGGAFVNFEGGSYDDFHYTSTSGAGLKMLKWTPDRPFVFFENGIFYKRYFSVYQSMQLDRPSGNQYQVAPGAGIGRSFTTVRFQPHPRVELSVNHTYFRDLPTFDPALIQTGLLDKFLFQGFSAGARVEVYKQIWLSTDLGMSNRTGDKKSSLNQMYGITFGHLPWIGLHADARYTRFNSAFGSGTYEALSFSKNLGETLQVQFLAGQQNFTSSLTAADRSRFVNGMIEYSLGAHYFVQGGATMSRGAQMNYDQWLFTFGYRFDNRNGHKSR